MPVRIHLYIFVSIFYVSVCHVIRRLSNHREADAYQKSQLDSKRLEVSNQFKVLASLLLAFKDPSATYVPSTMELLHGPACGMPPVVVQTRARTLLCQVASRMSQSKHLFSGHAHFEHVPQGVLGPPAHFDNLQVRTQCLSVSRECSITRSPINFEIVRLASRPAIFHVGGLLSEAECDHIIAAADTKGFVDNAGNMRAKCSSTVLPVEGDDVLATIDAGCQQLFLKPDALESSNWSNGVGVEPIVVNKYSEGGECRIHHDCTEGRHRIITVVIYLTSVGETWFPLALQDHLDAQDVANANPAFTDAMITAKRLKLGHGGVVAAPKKGDAVAFYNYVDNGSGEFDGLAVHAGLPAPGKKSIATLFYRVSPRSIG